MFIVTPSSAVLSVILRVCPAQQGPQRTLETSKPVVDCLFSMYAWSLFLPCRVSTDYQASEYMLEPPQLLPVLPSPSDLLSSSASWIMSTVLVRYGVCGHDGRCSDMSAAWHLHRHLWPVPNYHFLINSTFRWLPTIVCSPVSYSVRRMFYTNHILSS